MGKKLVCLLLLIIIMEALEVLLLVPQIQQPLKSTLTIYLVPGVTVVLSLSVMMPIKMVLR